MKLETKLMREARAASLRRGHVMPRKLTHLSDHTSEIVCKACGMRVTVNTRPAPNEIDIGGPAVALDCNPPRSTLKVVQVEAWREPEGGWTYNNIFKLDKYVWIGNPETLTPRRVLKLFRDWGILTDFSKGHLRVDMGNEFMDATHIEIQNKNTGEPWFALTNLYGD